MLCWSLGNHRRIPVPTMLSCIAVVHAAVIEVAHPWALHHLSQIPGHSGSVAPMGRTPPLYAVYVTTSVHVLCGALSFEGGGAFPEMAGHSFLVCTDSPPGGGGNAPHAAAPTPSAKHWHGPFLQVAQWSGESLTRREFETPMPSAEHWQASRLRLQRS